MELKDLEKKRITVMGLGLLGGGVGLVRFLAKSGARLLVTDLKSKAALKESLDKLKDLNISYILGEHRAKDFTDCDIVVKNPAVSLGSPYICLAREKNIPIESDVSLFLKLKNPQVIGVTGTKGKTTTANLIYEFLKEDYPCFLAGVAGGSPFDFFERMTAKSIVILELSSWQLELLAIHKLSPHGAVITNIYPDHLNSYKTFEEYICAKKNIFLFQKNEDFIVLNEDDSIVNKFRNEAKGEVYTFGHKDIQKIKKIIPLERILLRGEPNLMNIVASLRVAKLYHIKNVRIKKVLETFKGVSYRQEFIRKLAGVSFYNDTTATIPEAAIATMKSLATCIILIAGGSDKNLDYTLFAQEIKKRAAIKKRSISYIVLFPGEASEKIRNALRNARYSEKNILAAKTMVQAVQTAFMRAKVGDSVLLSPAAASFGMFKNEFDRGNQFNAAVYNLHP